MDGCYHYSLAQRSISQRIHIFLATLSIICKCGILGIGLRVMWCASGRGFYSGRRFIAQSLSCSSFHRLEMTEILLKGRKTLTHPSIYSGRARPTEVFKLVLSLGAQIIRTGTYAHMQARTRTPYCYGTQAKSKVDEQ